MKCPATPFTSNAELNPENHSAIALTSSPDHELLYWMHVLIDLFI